MGHEADRQLVEIRAAAEAFCRSIAPLMEAEPDLPVQGMPSDGDSREIYRRMGEAGWIGLHWPRELGGGGRSLLETIMGYKFQFITLAGWHLINLHTFELARAYSLEGMPAYVRLQQAEFAREAEGYTAVRHQREVGTGYFDAIVSAISRGAAATIAWVGSTEAEQFH